MTRALEAVIEEWDGPNHSQKRARVSQEQDLRAILQALGASRSAALSMEVVDGLLIVGASGGIYTVSVMLSTGEAFDRLAANQASGTVAFFEGGQSVALPRRHALTLELALAAASEFLAHGTVDSRSGWQAQA